MSSGQVQIYVQSNRKVRVACAITVVIKLTEIREDLVEVKRSDIQVQRDILKTQTKEN